MGIFTPEENPRTELSSGEIGYIITGIKKPGIASVGDTITFLKKPMPALSGYQNPRPVVWLGLSRKPRWFYCLKTSFKGRLKLSHHSSFSFEEETSELWEEGSVADFWACCT